MVELLGIALATVVIGACWAAWRAGAAVLRLIGVVRHTGQSPAHLLRARRLRASRALARQQADRLVTLQAELLRTRAELRLRRREAELLRVKLGRVDDRFARAKRAFALRFHPDRVGPRGLDSMLRRALFQEYWAVLQRIERS